MISSGQLFGLLTVNSLILMVSTNSIWLGGSDLLDQVISCSVLLVLNFIVVIPLGLLYRRKPTMNILDYGDYLTGWFGTAITFFYGLYFLIVNCYYLSAFQVFNSNMVNPEVSSWAIITAVLAVAIYTAWKGLESISRTAAFILVMVLIGLLFIFITVTPQIRTENFKPILYDGWHQTIQGTILFFGRSTGIATLAILLPMANGNKKIGFTIWNIVTYLLMSIMLVIIVGVLGNAIQTQLFPVYTLASMAGVGSLQRLDSILLVVWLMGALIKVSVDLYLFGMCMQRIFRIKWGGLFIILGAIIVGIVSIIITKSAVLQRLFFHVYLMAPLTLFAAFIIPFVLLLIDTVKCKNRTIRRAATTLEVKHESYGVD